MQITHLLEKKNVVLQTLNDLSCEHSFHGPIAQHLKCISYNGEKSLRMYKVLGLHLFLKDVCLFLFISYLSYFPREIGIDRAQL